MIGPQFLYFLVDAGGRFYYDNNGVLAISGTPVPLTSTPDGWLDIAIAKQRGPKYFALDRSFTLPLNFVNDGASIVKNLYYNKGVEALLYLRIAQRALYWQQNTGFLTDQDGNPILDQNGNPILTEQIGEYGFYHTQLYKGEIDFSKFLHSGPKVTAPIMEGDYVKLIKAFENTVYDIPMNPYILVQMDGVQLVQKATWVVGGEQHDNHVLGMNFVAQEAISSIGASSQTLTGVSNTLPDLWNVGQSFLQTFNVDTDVTLTWDFIATPTIFVPLFNPDDGTYMQLQLAVLKDVHTIIYQQNIQQFGGGAASDLFGHPQHFQGSLTITIPAGCRVILYMNVTHKSQATNIAYVSENSLITANYSYTHKTSYVRAMRPFDLFKAISAKMGITNVRSSFLQKYEYIVVTTGDGMRGIPTADVHTSLLEFYNSFNSIFPIALGVQDGVLILELKEDLVQYTDVIDLGEISNLKASPATDYLFNTIKIGFPEQNYTDVNGKYEFNNTHIYTTPITKVTKELTLVSKYRGDCFGAEFARINLEGKTTTDSAADDTVFFLHINAQRESDPNVIFNYWKLDRQRNAYVTGGLPKPAGVFNLWLTPKQCLLRQGRFLHSCFYQMDDQYLVFQSTEKNSAVAISSYNGQPPVIENANVSIGSLGAPLFTPNLLEFDTQVPLNLLDRFRSNPYAAYSFTNAGVQYFGLPQKDTIRPADNKWQSYQVLSAPSNNLLNLIGYNG